MHWKLKALLQNTIARLPRPVGDALYFHLQRSAGGFRVVDPIPHLRMGLASSQAIIAAGKSPIGGVFFEVGTGWIPLIPLTYWLVGAKQVLTFDLNRYLSADLVRTNLRTIAARERQVYELFGDLLQRDRFAELRHLARTKFQLADFLHLCAIRYEAPADAARTGLPDATIDFHTSNNVFEHIPPEVLSAIIFEGVRIMRKSGLFVHRIDYGDHFAHSDSRICLLNFLCYSADEWRRLAGNRFMYMNRLRHDDHRALWQQAGLRIVAEHTQFDQKSADLLRSGALRLDKHFREMLPERLAITGGRIVAATNAAQPPFAIR